MTKYRMDYIWLDGNQPTANLRTKAQILEFESFDGNVSELPLWGFDGSSTNQAEGHDSDCVLKPVRAYNNPLHKNAWFVLCEVFNRDGSVHPTNYRNNISDKHDEQFWFGF